MKNSTFRLSLLLEALGHRFGSRPDSELFVDMPEVHLYGCLAQDKCLRYGAVREAGAKQFEYFGLSCREEPSSRDHGLANPHAQPASQRHITSTTYERVNL